MRLCFLVSLLNLSVADSGAADLALFSHTFELHRVALRRYAERFVRSRDTAEDLVQDVFSRLWVRWRGIDFASNVRAYLYQATRTHALNHGCERDDLHDLGQPFGSIRLVKASE